MMVTLAYDMTRHIIQQLLSDGGNHRLAVFQAINETFIRYALDFLDRAAEHKAQWVDGQSVNVGEQESAAEQWYTDFLRDSFVDINEAEIIGAIPKKTIGNIYGGKGKAVVQRALIENVTHLVEGYEEARALRGGHAPISLEVDGVAFSAAETILLTNSLAVKRQQISGGFWSAVGNAVEKPLLIALCRLYNVDKQYHREGLSKDNRYQVDYMLHRSGVEYRCEVKLNGRGNPESVTGAIPRSPRIVFADYISAQNREKLDASDIKWVDFSEDAGFRRFGEALKMYGIPHQTPSNLDALDDILDTILPLP